MARDKINHWFNAKGQRGSVNTLMLDYHKSKAALANQVMRVPYHILQEVMGGVKMSKRDYDALRIEIVYHIENCPRALSSWREAANDYLVQMRDMG